MLKKDSARWPRDFAAIESVEGGGGSSNATSLRDRLSALRKIVNASVQAMKADEGTPGAAQEK